MPVHRRDFNLGILKTSAAAFLSPRLLAQPLAGLAACSIASPTNGSTKNSNNSSTSNETTPIAALYRNAIVIDSLCGPLVDLDTPPTPEILAAVRQSGITAINFTISQASFEDTVANIAVVEAL